LLDANTTGKAKQFFPVHEQIWLADLKRKKPLMGLEVAGKSKPPVANDAKLFYYVFGAFIIHLSSLL